VLTRRCGLVLLFLLAYVNGALSSDLKSLEKQAKMEFFGKTLLMNHPYLSNKLHFNATGVLIGQSEEGTWPTNGLLRVDDVELKPSLVRLQGTREILTLRTQDGRLGLQPILLTKRIEIELEPASVISSIEDVKGTVALVFREENLGRKMNEYWHGMAKVTGVDPKSGGIKIEGATHGIYGYLDPDRPVYFVNPPLVQPPKATHKEETDYTKAAAVKRTQGKTFMLVIINEKGYPEFLHLIKDLGDDLDVQAMAGTSQWRFRPATKDGEPVACVVRIGWEFTSLY
jgi:Gram-negative bacterial TonB protein C-terminal